LAKVGKDDRLLPAIAANEEVIMARKAAPKQPVEADVVSLKVTLRNIDPPIWRRIIMPRDMTLADVHDAIQAVMEWDGDHMHGFDFGRRRSPVAAMLAELVDEEEQEEMTLDELVKTGMTRFTYIYDFGDSWKHDVLIEKRLPATTATAFPACVAGARKGPPEDCGGLWGYEQLLAAVADPNHPDRKERLEWLGDNYDPEAFSVADADARLARRFRRAAPAAAG
jgi:hypothetical protein